VTEPAPDWKPCNSHIWVEQTIVSESGAHKLFHCGNCGVVVRALHYYYPPTEVPDWKRLGYND